MKRIAILGSTGSIGQSALKVARHLPSEFEIVALTARNNIDRLEQQVHEFRPKYVAVFDETQAARLQAKLPNTKVLSGPAGMQELASLPQVELVVAGMSGTAGLLPTIAAIEAGKTIALANKEVLVSAGELVTSLARKHGVTLLPVDSEHNALFQCLKDEPTRAIRRLIITASGGPFRTFSDEMLAAVTLDQALRHPNFAMGPKITIDSSTLMNKGLEVIEAMWLFNIPLDRIEVVVQPQQIIHSMVEFIDGSILAQLGAPDMVTPIQYAMTYPARLPGTLAPFDFIKNHTIEFVAPDTRRFPCLDLAFAAAKAGGSTPCYLNAANEILVQRFLERQIPWQQIGRKLEQLITKHERSNISHLADILEVDSIARREAASA